jgi:hypothetical protein
VSADPTPSAPADVELIAQLKSRLQYAELRIRVLEERLRLMRIEKYGAGSEKLSHAQMELFELEPVVSETIEQAESEHAPVHRWTKRAGKHPGRQELPPNFPRVERVLPCTPDQRVCKRCGKENHTPLHRQSVILKRDIGLEISRATLDGWVLKVGELLIPMLAAMRRELISGTYIQADETPVDVQMHEGRGKNYQAYLWQYSRPAGTVVFDFRLGRGRDGPKHFLGQFEGILQTDGYTAYDQIGGKRMVHAACWAHARRQFFEAVQLNPRDPVATPIVARMDELFAVDAEARRRVIGLTGRHAASEKSQASPG